MKYRPLRKEERVLIEALLDNEGVVDSYIEFLDQARVADMKDGGMGSIQFESYDSRQYGKTLAEARYQDTDGVPVSIALNVDKDENLFELDIWKVDFSPLNRYPQTSDLEFRKFGN